jgi:hypothetical protein
LRDRLVPVLEQRQEEGEDGHPGVGEHVLAAEDPHGLPEDVPVRVGLGVPDLPLGEELPRPGERAPQHRDRGRIPDPREDHGGDASPVELSRALELPGQGRLEGPSQGGIAQTPHSTTDLAIDAVLDAPEASEHVADRLRGALVEQLLQSPDRPGAVALAGVRAGGAAQRDQHPLVVARSPEDLDERIDDRLAADPAHGLRRGPADLRLGVALDTRRQAGLLPQEGDGTPVSELPEPAHETNAHLGLGDVREPGHQPRRGGRVVGRQQGFELRPEAAGGHLAQDTRDQPARGRHEEEEQEPHRRLAARVLAEEPDQSPRGEPSGDREGQDAQRVHDRPGREPAHAVSRRDRHENRDAPDHGQDRRQPARRGRRLPRHLGRPSHSRGHASSRTLLGPGSS